MAMFLRLILLSLNLILINNIRADIFNKNISNNLSMPVTASPNTASSNADFKGLSDVHTVAVPHKIFLEAPVEDPKKSINTKPVIIDQAQKLEPKLGPKLENDLKHDGEFVPEVNTNQEGGNWVQKRIWWEQAEAAFAQLTQDNNQILQIQADYFKQRTIVEKQLNTVLCDLNISRADLVNFIDKLLEFTSAVPNIATAAPDKTNATVSQYGQAKATGDHKNSADINSNNSGNNTNARLKKLATSQQVGLENIKTYLTNLKLIDDALDQVLAELNKQIELCQDYEKQAWDDFKEIGRILNDKKAKILFYQVGGYQKNIQKILEYVTGALKKFFDDQVGKTKKNCEDLNQELKQLAAGGLGLRLELDIIAGRTPEPVDLQAEKLAAAKKAKANQGWFSFISDGVINFFSYIWIWIAGLFR